MPLVVLQEEGEVVGHQIPLVVSLGKHLIVGLFLSLFDLKVYEHVSCGIGSN